MRVNRFLHVFLILLMTASQLASGLHAVGHVTVHPQEHHAHDGSEHHGIIVGFRHELAHERGQEHNHAHALGTTPDAPDTGHTIEPDCLAYHLYLSLCAIAASHSEALVPPHQAIRVVSPATPEPPIGRVTHHSIRGPPALS